MPLPVCLPKCRKYINQEIADKLGISAETVKKHIQHALATIKAALSKSSVSISLLLGWVIK
jgi:RNA polymerase sigma-70 factor (ECF subfamily)